MTRKELRLSILKQLVKHHDKGNLIWGISPENQIVCYEMHKRNGDWEYNFFREEDNPPFFNCPQTFLLDFPDGNNIQWRENCKRHSERISELRKEIKALWTLRTEDKEIVVTLNENTDIGRLYKEEIKLNLFSISPLLGRYPRNKRLYLIPIRLIKKIELKEKS